MRVRGRAHMVRPIPTKQGAGLFSGHTRPFPAPLHAPPHLVPDTNVLRCPGHKMRALAAYHRIGALICVVEQVQER